MTIFFTYLSSTTLNRRVPLLTVCFFSLLTDYQLRYIPFRLNMTMEMQWQTFLMWLIKLDIILEFAFKANNLGCPFLDFNFNTSFVDNSINSFCNGSVAQCGTPLNFPLARKPPFTFLSFIARHSIKL